MTKDVFFMRRAIGLARRGVGRVHPNPLVGAVVVKGGRIIGEGAHEKFGGPHAEVCAIGSAKANPAGSTLYVTLEPCDHFGKTPPCTDFILQKGVRKVVVAAKDPNPLVSGKGLRRLRKKGVRVVTGVLEKEALELNKDFRHWIRKRMPYVTVKVAQSLDGKIATRTGLSRWITGREARLWGHQLRAFSDAVLVGVNTLLKDDPRLDVRLPKGREGRQSAPARVVLDSSLRTPPQARLFSKGTRGPVILAVTKKAAKKRIGLFKGKAEILWVKEKGGRVDLRSLFEMLGKRGIVRVLIEGGGETIASAFAERLVQEAYFLIAPKILGGRKAAPSVGGKGAGTLKEALSLDKVEARFLGKDLLVHGSIA
ncbi:MAG: bifunctional diaminohydroxyphosphoribosylaminopyrimidine deaminase/5-amino-6-(5-phosphoribosylamino)uracil reductase RibD [Candidatus Omnitrophica bacterium]|nr:bifunctional diaminohydroxyphosphoribosylaminopyrimidine deaminase/5-amino-6-(5-phosphoribosylamino)uracil reductase RibD [Candidatus Omnitrophota bacterium]